MSATTRTLQRPAGAGSLVATLGGAVAILATTLAIAWGAANIEKPTSVTMLPPALDRVTDHGPSAGSGLSSGAGLNLAPRAQ